ncbi:hypothetical protein ABT147_00845 [Streptomyces sp. NPDC001868]|uniref:hypothetical protein n=1 Tax=Streptomyces sp. NPDC001868 TaxID=3154401 RepID=UPI00332806D9
MRLEVSGAGLLLGLDSADPSTEERFDATECRTYEGRALVVLRPTGPGKIRLLATAADCDPVEVLVVTNGSDQTDEVPSCREPRHGFEQEVLAFAGIGRSPHLSPPSRPCRRA